MAPRAHVRSIQLAARVVPETPTRVVGDPGRFQQILNNLLGNAVKLTGKGSVLLTIESHLDNVPGHLQFAVKDTGIGIAADKTAAIFNEFTQAESSTTRRFGGTGLGLGICRRLVDRMGGKLTVESVLGEGSTFSFDLTFPLSRSAAVEPAATDSADFNGRRVLIVDDNPQ